MNSDVELSVSEFVAVLNQTLEYAYASIIIHGELANFRVARGQWVYFSLKDEAAKVDFFGSVYRLPGPLEDGMMLKVRGTPRLHPLYGFSVNFSSINPTGSGSIHRLNELTRAKLEQEGLFAPERKRPIAYPPQKIGLVTSSESAAYADFIKILGNRWAGLSIEVINVAVQGEEAAEGIIRAIDYFSSAEEPAEVLVLIRGGGSPEDLAVFNNELLVRAVAASRVPTLVAIGHERDVTLAELAADRRASTPSNAAELLVPDKRYVQDELSKIPEELSSIIQRKILANRNALSQIEESMLELLRAKIEAVKQQLVTLNKLLTALAPGQILKRGYAIVYNGARASDGTDLVKGDKVEVAMAKARFEAAINSISRT